MLAMIKAIHIVGFVAWFSGLFYLGRLFIYLCDIQSRPESERTLLSEQFNLMAARVNTIIIHPAMAITLIAGFGLASMVGAFSQGWFHIKVTLILLLVGYTIVCGRLRKRFARQDFGNWSPLRLRYFNESASLFLIVIVVLAVFRNEFMSQNVLLGLAAVVLLILLAVKRSVQKS